MLVVEEEGIVSRSGELASLEASLAEQDGVAGVVGPGAQRLPGGSGVLLAPNGNAARYVLVLDGDPDGARASEALSSVKERLRAHVNERGRLGIEHHSIVPSTAVASRTPARNRIGVGDEEARLDPQYDTPFVLFPAQVGSEKRRCRGEPAKTHARPI
jgi:RND superfamily putative drug exporter